MDHYYLDRCYHLALQNSGSTAPNPSVGAVVVSQGQIVGEGYHSRAGDPHAEIVALERSGASAENAVLYCSLEPCAHHGKTPPCVDRIVSAGIRRVVFGAVDRNPNVQGNGEAILRSHGMEVRNVSHPAIERFYFPFFHSSRHQRPYVICKAAITANGLIAPADRNSKWISGELSRLWVQHLRAQCDGLLIGSGTMKADRPHLNVRLTGVRRQPHRIVVDPKWRIHPSQFSLSLEDGPILICGETQASDSLEALWREFGATTLRYFGVEDLLRKIYLRGIGKIVVEGGQRIFTMLQTAGLIDEYILIMAPKFLTGIHSLNFLGGPDQTLADAKRLTLSRVMELDGDLVVSMNRAS